MDEKTIIVMAVVEDDQAEAAKGGNIMTERQPTADEIAGMA
jgi:hypothetical protein